VCGHGACVCGYLQIFETVCLIYDSHECNQGLHVCLLVAVL
jgi:hypothetical protein